MQITFKLYAGLAQYLPDEASNNRVDIDILETESINGIMNRLNVPLEKVHLVLINGVYVQPQHRDEAQVFKDGDTLAVWPPVAGG